MTNIYQHAIGEENIKPLFQDLTDLKNSVKAFCKNKRNLISEYEKQIANRKNDCSTQ